MTTTGELNKRFSIIRNTKVADGAGGFMTTKAVLATVWGKKTTHRSDEAMQAMQTTGIAVHNIRIRYRTDVRSSDIILDIAANKYMAIIGPPMEVNESIGRHWLDVTCKEAA